MNSQNGELAYKMENQQPQNGESITHVLCTDNGSPNGEQIKKKTRINIPKMENKFNKWRISIHKDLLF